jgi:predicted N-acetyltransferase YhbS
MDRQITVLVYDPLTHETDLMDLIEAQGFDWACYWEEESNAKYRNALQKSVTRVAFVDGQLAGYVRALDDQGFYIYVCDLLVAPVYRGMKLGQQLMTRLVRDFPQHTVYVMSDADGYYEKVGYIKVGSVYEIPSTPEGQGDE